MPAVTAVITGAGGIAAEPAARRCDHRFHQEIRRSDKHRRGDHAAQ
jgi:hypothetical protein